MVAFCGQIRLSCSRHCIALITAGPSGTLCHLPAEEGEDDESLFIVTLSIRGSKEDAVFSVTVMRGGTFHSIYEFRQLTFGVNVLITGELHL